MCHLKLPEVKILVPELCSKIVECYFSEAQELSFRFFSVLVCVVTPEEQPGAAVLLGVLQICVSWSNIGEFSCNIAWALIGDDGVCELLGL